MEKNNNNIENPNNKIENSISPTQDKGNLSSISSTSTSQTTQNNSNSNATNNQEFTKMFFNFLKNNSQFK